MFLLYTVLTILINAVSQLSRYFEDKFGHEDEKAILLRSASAAHECHAFLAARDVTARILDYERPQTRPGAEVHVVFYPYDAFLVAKQFWQHTGFGITTRLADLYISLLDIPGQESVFNSRRSENTSHEEGADVTNAAADAKLAIRQRLANLVDTDSDSVWLYPSGMQAIWSIHQACMSSLGPYKSVCFG